MPSPPRNKLLIDCSSTITCEFNSGIQRVVRSICQQALLNETEMSAAPVYGHEGRFYPTTNLWPAKPASDWSALAAQSRIAEAYRKAANSVYARFPNKKFKKLFLPERGRAGIFKLPKLAIKTVQKLVSPNNSRAVPSTPSIDFRPRDILLMSDASWQKPNWDCIDSARSSGAIVGNLIYDLIPITHPQFFQPELVQRFTQWFNRAAAESDFFLCISECVAQQVRSQLVRTGHTIEHAERVCLSFPLGADLTSWNESEVQSHIKSLFSGSRLSNPYFVVGTLEPRKNHTFILDAFDKMWRAGSEERLCIAGRIGWNCESLADRIRSHAEFNKKLFMSNNASDADIGYGYQNAKSVIMASHTEGFGLPIVEALAMQQTVLASDTPIHREVGQNRVRYFSINASCDSLIEAIEGVTTTGMAVANSNSAYRPTPWSESYVAAASRIRDMVDYIENARGAVRAA